MRRSLPAALAASLLTIPALLAAPAMAQQAPTSRSLAIPPAARPVPRNPATSAAPSPAPSAAQAQAEANMRATAPYTAGPRVRRPGPGHNSQTMGGAQGPTFHALGVPVTIDAPVAAPYSNSWANNVGGQPGTGAQTMARGMGLPAH